MLAADYAAFAQPGRLEAFGQTMRECLRQGARGAAWDLGFYVREFGFDLGEVRIPVTLFHGDHDTNAPLAMVQRAAAQLPAGRLVIYEGEAHLSTLCNHIDEITRALTGPSSALGDVAERPHRLQSHKRSARTEWNVRRTIIAPMRPPIPTAAVGGASTARPPLEAGGRARSIVRRDWRAWLHPRGEDCAAMRRPVLGASGRLRRRGTSRPTRPGRPPGRPRSRESRRDRQPVRLRQPHVLPWSTHPDAIAISYSL